MDTDIRKTALYLKQEYEDGRMDEETCQFFLKMCILVLMDRHLTPKIDKLEDKISHYIEKSLLGHVDG